MQSAPPLPSIPFLMAALDSTVRIETFILDYGPARWRYAQRMGVLG